MSQNFASMKDKIFSNPAGYAIFYVCLAVPTYIIPWIKPGVMSKAAEASGYANGASAVASVYTVIQLCLFAGLVWAAHVRGQKTNKSYLKYFALTAGVFDLVPLLSFIPLVPSVMHAMCMGMGLSDQPKIVEQYKAEPQPESHSKAA